MMRKPSKTPAPDPMGRTPLTDSPARKDIVGILPAGKAGNRVRVETVGTEVKP